MLKYMSILYYRVSLLVHNLQKELEIDIVKGKGIAGFRAFYLVVGFGFFFFFNSSGLLGAHNPTASASEEC